MGRWVVLLGVSWGCAGDYRSTTSESDVADTASIGAEEADSDTGMDQRIPAYWKLGAELQVLEGAVVAESSRVTVTLYDADLVSICNEERGLVESTTLKELPHESVLGWWQVGPGESDGGCLAWASPIPNDLRLGIGEMNTEIVAGLGFMGLDGLEGTLNAAYASLDVENSLVVYGAAGTEEAYAGEGGPATEHPIPDGTWSLLPLYSFELDEVTL